MKQIAKGLRLMAFTFIMGICATTMRAAAQTPANDPGIGGPGVGTQPQGDGSPVVPFDGGMGLMFAASGIGYAYRKIRRK